MPGARTNRVIEQVLHSYLLKRTVSYVISMSWYDKIKKSNKLSSFINFCLASIVFLLIFGVVYKSTQKNNEVDWLAAHDWSRFVGAENKNGSLHISPTGRDINHKDTSTAQPNPPVNVGGPHLKISGDFRIKMDVSGIDNDVTAQFYGQVPIIYDEWRQERGSIKIEAKKDGVTARIWDGTSSSSIDERIFKIDLKDSAKLLLVHKLNEIHIRVNNRYVGSIPDHNIFAQGTVWFGADAKPGTQGWALNSLTAEGVGKGSAEVVPSPNLASPYYKPTDALQSLSSANPRRLLLGAAVSINPLMTDEQYRNIALGQFGMMTPENSLKPQFVHPQKDLYLFHDVDSLVEVARQNNMVVHGHALVLGKSNPEWMQKTPENERKRIMIDHISEVVGHYRGKIAQWDVVNEPLSEDQIDYLGAQKGLRKQMWFDAMGEEYIDIAFKAAHTADPKAKLYLNDFGLEKDGQRWDTLISLVKRLQARGVPIHGVGFESHVYHKPADNIDPVVLKKHIQILASMGIASRISEIDVLGDDPNLQAKQYSGVLKVCMSEPTCTSYGVWGINDLYGSTTLSDRYPVKLGDSLLWGENYTPKPALESLKTVLRKQER